MAKKNQQLPAANNKPETEEVEQLSEHRILVSNVADPLNPQVVPLVIVATDRAAAVEKANGLTNPFTDPLPRGSHRSRCRLEEVLPFAREGFAIRRDKWPVPEVALMHPGISTRFDIYFRNQDQPHFAPQHQRELTKLSGPDLLSEDWSVCARPPNFGNRGQ